MFVHGGIRIESRNGRRITWTCYCSMKYIAAKSLKSITFFYEIEKFRIEILIRKIFGEKFIAYNYNKFYLFTNILFNLNSYNFLRKLYVICFSFHQNALGQNVEL